MKKVRYTAAAVCLLLLMLPFQNCSPGFEVANRTIASSDEIFGDYVGTTADLYKPDAYGNTGLRRLTRSEALATLQGIFGVDPKPFEGLYPEDIPGSTFFDNDYGTVSVSPITISYFDTFAEGFAPLVASSAGVVQRLASCQPKSEGDRDCFIQFAQKVGRRLFRRPITSAEANFYADAFLPFAIEDKRFETAVQLLVQMFTTHPEFLYRIESGTASSSASGLLELDSYEVATRMAFLLWGQAPDDALLDAADSGALKTEQGREAQAIRMLNDPRAVHQWQRYHAQWLGYETVPLPTLADDFQQESAALISRIVFQQELDWMSLFTFNETYVTPALAQHYGMPAISSPSWVKYGGSLGGGILSHGTFSAIGAKFNDTSPSKRGYEIYKRLLCGKFDITIPGTVDTTIPPGNPGDCKPQAYFMRQVSTCAGCHTTIDGIGFGLENVSGLGTWRTVEPNKTQCQIEGAGTINGFAFSGPKDLGEYLAKSSVAQHCASRQLFRYLTGRMDAAEDQAAVGGIYAHYRKNQSLKSLLVNLVKTPAITFKRNSI